MEEHFVRHLGVIMDGNRRWARQHRLESIMRGHEKGVDTFMDLCTWCQDEHIPYLSVYAFSTENWERSREEVASLFKLMEKFFTEEVETCIARDIRVIVVGDLSRLDESSRNIIRLAEERTSHCANLTVQIAISYGGRDEIVRAVRKIAALAAEGKFRADGPDGSGAFDADLITEQTFETFLDTAGIPDIDLVIRTGGNQRLSNFFPWQTVYAEICFTDTLWPDFTHEEMKTFLEYYRTIQINKGK